MNNGAFEVNVKNAQHVYQVEAKPHQHRKNKLGIKGHAFVTTRAIVSDLRAMNKVDWFTFLSNDSFGCACSRGNKSEPSVRKSKMEGLYSCNSLDPPLL